MNSFERSKEMYAHTNREIHADMNRESQIYEMRGEKLTFYEFEFHFRFLFKCAANAQPCERSHL